MDRIIFGTELSNYRTIGIALGVSKKQNNQGQLSKFAVSTVQDTYTGFATPKRTIMFEEDMGMAYPILQKYVDPTIVDPRGGQIVSLTQLKANQDDYNMVKGLLEIPGMMAVSMPLRKGMCYANDVNGSPITDRIGNKVTRDHVEVMVIIRCIRPGDNGQSRTDYVSGWDPESQRDRIESRFYTVPVTAQNTGMAQGDEFIPVQSAQAAPQQSAQMPPQQSAPTQQATQQATQMPPQQPAAAQTVTPF